jgi:hypothetical protein
MIIMAAGHIVKEAPSLRYRAESVRSLRTKTSRSWSIDTHLLSGLSCHQQ